MANSECSCTSHIMMHFSSNLVTLIQSYLHSAIGEDFYKSKLLLYRLCLRVNKRFLPTVESLSTCGLLLNTAESFVVNALIVELKPRSGAKSNPSIWLDFKFVVGSTRYFFCKCLSANMVSLNTEINIVPDAVNSYRNCYNTLVNLCLAENKDKLFAEILQTCSVIPNANDFEMLRRVLLTKILNLITEADLYIAIHA
jgi:hypothetical protein